MKMSGLSKWVSVGLLLAAVASAGGAGGQPAG